MIASSIRRSPVPLSVRAIAAVALLAGLVLLATMNMQFNLYDEAIIAQGAVEVMSGHVPHRDFYFNYGPAQLWIVAGLFSVFGKSVLVGRLYDIAVRAGIVLVCGLWLRRMRVGATVALGALALETALLVAAGYYLYVVFPTALVALTGTLILIAPEPGAGVPARRLVGAGALTGLAALFRYDAGFFILLAHLATLAWLWLAAGERFGLLWRRVILYGLGTALVFLPVAVAAWLAGVVPGFVHDIIAFPSAYYVRMRGLPWPRPHRTFASLAELICYLPVPVALLGVASLGVRRRSGGAGAVLAPTDKLLAALAPLTAALFLKGFVRLSMLHVAMGVIPAVLLLAGLLSIGGSRMIRRAALILGACAAGTIGAGVLAQARTDWRGDHRDMFVARVAGRTPGAMTGAPCPRLLAMSLGTVDPDSYRAACFIETHTRPGEPILVGAGRHDKLFVDQIGLYFITERMPGTHWYQFDPGLQTRADVQRAMIRDLTDHRVRLVATDGRFDDMKEPNDSARSSHVHLLDRFIHERYRVVARFGPVAIHMADAANGGPAPAGR